MTSTFTGKIMQNISNDQRLSGQVRVGQEMIRVPRLPSLVTLKGAPIFHTFLYKTWQTAYISNKTQKVTRLPGYKSPIFKDVFDDVAVTVAVWRRCLRFLLSLSNLLHRPQQGRKKCNRFNDQSNNAACP